jgi:hypothetical protein
MNKYIAILSFILAITGCATPDTPGQWYNEPVVEDISLESIAFFDDYAEIITRDKPMEIIYMRVTDVADTSITGDTLYPNDLRQPDGGAMKIDRSNILKIFIVKDWDPTNEWNLDDVMHVVGFLLCSLDAKCIEREIDRSLNKLFGTDAQSKAERAERKRAERHKAHVLVYKKGLGYQQQREAENQKKLAGQNRLGEELLLIPDLTGTYMARNTSKSLRSSPEFREMYVEVRLVQDGKKITGKFGGKGKIWGNVVDEKTIKFDTFATGGWSPKGTWVIDPVTNNLNGTIRSGEWDLDEWNLTRIQ